MAVLLTVCVATAPVVPSLDFDLSGMPDVVTVDDMTCLPAALEDELFTQREECRAVGFLCADLSPLARWRLPSRPVLVDEGQRFTVEFTPSEKERVLVLAYLYRPDWKAFDDTGRALNVVGVGGALLAAEVPPGASGVTLIYSPHVRRALLLLGFLGFLSVLGLLIHCLARDLRAHANQGP